jgi:hypothetical protein
VEVAVRFIFVGKGGFKGGFPVEAPFLLRIAVRVFDREDVQTVPPVDYGARWAPNE